MWQSQVENEHYSTVSGLIRLVTYTLRLVFLAMSKFSVFGVKRIWRVLILAFFFLKNTVS